MKLGRLGPFIAIIAAAVIWGFSFLSIKVSIAVFPPMTLALTRFLIASVFLLAVLHWQEPETKINKKDIPLLSLAGVIGITLYFYFENNGVKLISASAASIIVAVVPILTLLVDVVFLKNKLNLQKAVSVIISVVGVYLVVGTTGPVTFFSGSGLGYLMMFGAMASWVVYSMVTRPLFKKYSQLAIVCYQTVFGTAALIPFVFFEKTDWRLVTIPIVLNVFFLGVFCSAFAYYFYVFALDKLGVNISALFLNLVPVVGVIASCLILKERLLVTQVLGGLLVVVAVSIVEMGKTKKIPADQKEPLAETY